MNVCSHCFADKELVGYIDSQAVISRCEFCESINVNCLPVEELSDFFLELTLNFKKSETGQSFKNLIQGNWGLFSTPDIGAKILNYFFSKTATFISHADELVDFTDEIKDNIGYWDQLKDDLVNKNRYLTDINKLVEDLGWDDFLSGQIDIKPGTPFYRARLHHKSGEPPFSPNEMYCPEPKFATAGRANPQGIPCLYLSDRQDTVLYEVRASYLDEISIGTFEVRQDIGGSIPIADFTSSGTLFHPSRVGDRIKSSLLKKKISYDLSKPMRRYDSELDYVPTQFICEFIKIYTGVHGIKFRSSLHVVGNNFVIFNQEVIQCISVEKVKVNRVIISV